MRGQSKIASAHRSKKAYIHVRQSSMKQVVEHQVSGRRQRELASWVQEMGWSPSATVVLEADQGKSGQSSQQREAFKQLVGEVSLGEVGIVVGLYVSRLARNNADWFPLLEMCGLTRTLIADEEGVYDPNDPNDRLLLGLKGTLSEAEVQRIRSQLHGARWSKARRGELRRRLPTGYVYDERDRVVMDPDERIRHTLRSFFERFEQLGSACAVARSYVGEGLLFPTRWYRGKWDGPVRFTHSGVFRRIYLVCDSLPTFYDSAIEIARHVVVDKPTPETIRAFDLLPPDGLDLFVKRLHQEIQESGLRIALLVDGDGHERGIEARNVPIEREALRVHRLSGLGFVGSSCTEEGINSSVNVCLHPPREIRRAVGVNDGES